MCAWRCRRREGWPIRPRGTRHSGDAWLLTTSDHLLEIRSFMKERQGSREGAKTRRKSLILECFAPSCLRVSPPKSAIKTLRFPCSLVRWSGQWEGTLRCLPVRVRTDQCVFAEI